MERKEFVDKILGKTETRGAIENSLILLLGKNTYFQLTDQEKKSLERLTSFMLDRDMKIIELTIQEMKKIRGHVN